MEWPPNEPPERNTLRVPSGAHRRFSPFEFSGWSPDALEDDIPTAAKVYVGAVSDRDARVRAAGVAHRMGFSVVEDDQYAWVAERRVLADPAAARAEMGAARFALPIGGAVALAGLGWLAYLVAIGSTGDQLAATVVLGVGIAGAFGGSISWASGCYWSDLIVIDPLSDSATEESPDHPGPRRVTVFVGRGMTMDWETRGSHGRTVRLLLPDRTLEDVAEEVGTSVADDRAGPSTLLPAG